MRRHLNLVYATAFRKLQDQGGAEEVAQNVFAALVKKAWQFAPDDSLPAWLYKSTLLESAQLLRGELRRRRREQTAAELGTTMKTPDEQSALRALVPLLDEALLSLREKDRTALLLRFYENRSLKEVGASLGVGEDTAQKRVASALEKLSAFFQRRGFRTATVAAATAALQHTATAAPAAVANAVVLATGKMTPPALMGLSMLAARLASLTKLQTAALCLVLAATPVAWQTKQYLQAREQMHELQAQSAKGQAELAATEADIDRLNVTSTRLTASTESAAESARQRAGAVARFTTWKNRLRGLLTAANYHWPDDSPFVRIPKSALGQLSVYHPVAPPGMLKQEARELLGLTPDEREQIEAALHRHFAAMDGLIETNIYETNQSSHFYVPASAVASQIWGVPALGDKVQASGAELQTALEQTLGSERWPLVQSLLAESGPETLRRVLNLDAGKDQQEVGAWVQNINGQLTVNYGLSSGYSTMTSGGIPLAAFTSGADATMVENNAEHTVIGGMGLPGPLTQRILTWVQRQADAQAGKGATK